MEALRDGRGLAVSTTSVQALEHVELALASLLGARGDVDAHAGEALRVDPHCVLAHCVRAASLLLGGEPAASPAVERALAAIDLGRANDRERRHAAGLRAWFERGPRAALEHYGALLDEHPHDVLALALAHALDFRLGDRDALRDRVARALVHWRSDAPHFHHVLTMHAFGLEESGDYSAAEAQARRALDLARDDAAAMHVMAHVFEMRGRTREGIAWLEAHRPLWSASAGFAVHIAWHLALLHLDREDLDAAARIYEGALTPSPASPTAALVDASALLWRLELRGLRAGERWRHLAACWRRKPLRGARAFNLVHAALAFAGAGQDWRTRRVIRLLRDDALTRAANESFDLALAIPVCEAVRAFRRGDYALAVERMEIVRTEAEHCGGSVAQCDLIHLTFIEAALRSHRTRLAQALAAERTARKPRSRLNRWLYARADAVAGAA